MKSLLLLLILINLSAVTYGQAPDTLELGWLPPGHSWFEFSHRLATTANINPLLDRFYRGKFIYGYWKPIWRGQYSSVELSMVPQFLYGGFHERRIVLPAFNFRGELAFRYRLSKWLTLSVSNLHYSTHTMDNLPIETPDDVKHLREVKFAVDDINLLRIGLAWQGDPGWLADELSTEVGAQPWRFNYWLITEVDRFDDRSSYEPYDRRVFFEFGAGKRLGDFRLYCEWQGEFEQSLRSIIELRLSTQLNARVPNYDGLQLYLSYEGGNIGSNEVAITPHRGISRDWLVAGIRIFN